MRQNSFPPHARESRILFTLDDSELSEDIWEAALEVWSEGKKVVDVGVRLLKDGWEGEVRWQSPEVDVNRVKTEVPVSPPPENADKTQKGKKRARLEDTEETIMTLCRSADKNITFVVRPSTLVLKLKKAIAAQAGCLPDGGDVDLRLDSSGNIVRLKNEATLEEYEFGVGKPRTELWFQRCQIGGKPVIYIFPKEEQDVSCRLALVPEWSFSSVYPLSNIKQLPSGGQSIEWNVRAKPSGDLTVLDGSGRDEDDGLEVSYLFWEAHTNGFDRPPSPPLSSNDATSSSSSTEVTPFNPIDASLAPTDSVLLPFEEVTSYLDRALQSLGLHTEARTSFITYWLPSFQRHRNLLLRFVPQASCELSAPLTLSPNAADITTRVFLLFQGLPETEAVDCRWDEARDRGREKDVERWRDVVGVEEKSRQEDRTLTRVLEWGGMEVELKGRMGI